MERDRRSLVLGLDGSEKGLLLWDQRAVERGRFTHLGLDESDKGVVYSLLWDQRAVERGRFTHCMVFGLDGSDNGVAHISLWDLLFPLSHIHDCYSQ